MGGGRKLFLHKLIIASAILTVSFFGTITLLFLYVPVKVSVIAIPATVATVKEDVAVPSEAYQEPAKLKISNIGVEAVIKPVGVTAAGNMDIDENPKELAWYKFGPKPGEKGSAVIAGHYGWKDTVPSVFNNLNKLNKGDTISSYDGQGREITFVVTKAELYEPDQDATDVFKSKDGKSHLNLITCQGSWNNSARTYTERLVVFTDLVE